MQTGPSIETTELMLIPRPRTTVGYNSEAMRGRTTKDEDIPILPTQYNPRVTTLSKIKKLLLIQYLYEDCRSQLILESVSPSL